MADTNTYLDVRGWGGGNNISPQDREKYFEPVSTNWAKEAWRLKDGYEARYIGTGSTRDSLGSLTTYTNSYDDSQDSFNPNRDIQRYGVYESGGGGNAAEEVAEEEQKDSPRDTGEFEDILGALSDDYMRAKHQAEAWQTMQPKPIGDPVAPGPDPGIAANTDLISTLGQQFQDQLAALTQGQEARYAALEGVLQQQSQAMAESQAMMQQQMMAAQQSYSEQLRLMQNMQKANVPEAEENAFSAQIGDQRENVTRKKENNQLSDLSILSGLGTQGSPTAGFSLA